MLFNLEFRPQAENPLVKGQYLLYNQCDGYHKAHARFYKDGTFDGFFTFTGEEFPPDTYQAWARLPDTQSLYETFGDKPREGMTARQATYERLQAQARQRPPVGGYQPIGTTGPVQPPPRKP
jgi:hypothetical protein